MSFELNNLMIELGFSGLSNPSISYGTAAVTLSGTLSDNSRLAPNGEAVTVTLDGVEHRATISSFGAFSTTFDTAGLPVAGSPYTISYSYSSDGTFATANTTGTLTVTRATVSPVVTASNKLYDGTTTATLASETLIGVIDGDAVGLTGGTSSFASKNVGTDLTVTVTGLALDGAAAGNYQLASTTATTMAAISPAPFTIAITPSTNSAVFGQPVTFVAIVTSPAATTGGTVTFSDNGTTIATLPLDDMGQAILNTMALPIGGRSITASFNGGSDFVGVQSGSVSVSVTRASTQIVLIPHPVFQKKKLVALGLTAMIEPVMPAGGVPTGELMLNLLVKQKKKLTTKTLAATRVVGGEATFTLKPNQVLNKAIRVVYSGDLDDQPSSMLTTLTQDSLNTLARPMIAFPNWGRVRINEVSAVGRG